MPLQVLCYYVVELIPNGTEAEIFQATIQTTTLVLMHWRRKQPGHQVP